MKKVILIIGFLASCQQRPAFAADTRMHRIIFGAQITTCLASGFDGATTAAAIGVGAHETNPFLVKLGVQRQSYIGLGISKVIFCALPILAGKVAHKYGGETPFSDAVSLSGAAGSAGYFTWAGLNNLGVIRSLHAGSVKP